MRNAKNRTPVRHINLSQQNFHIGMQYEKLEPALFSLMLLNITVLRIVIEGAKPLIEVAVSGHCKRLEGRKFATVGTGSGNRHTKMRADVDGCSVEWLCNYETN